MHLLLAVLAGLAGVLAAGAAFTWAVTLWLERRYPPTGDFIEVDGARLHYRAAGPAGAPPVVLLHGACSNLVEVMLLIGSALSERHRVIAFDRPGHGWSTRSGDHDADPARQASLIAGALRRMGVRHAVIVGHSWSGTVAPALALDHPDVTGAVVVLSGVTFVWPGGYSGWYDRLTASWAARLAARTVAVPIGLLFFRSAARKTFSPQPVPRGFLDRAFIPLMFRPTTFHANARDFAAMRAAVERQSRRYHEIAVPLTVIAGDGDEIVWTDLHSRSLVREVPGAELVVLPGVGHMPHYARPDVVLPAIDAMAARIRPAEAPSP